MSSLQNTTVSLSIHGDDLDPEDVTRLLNCEPTAAWRKGDLRTPEVPDPNKVWSSGGWQLKSLLPREADLEDQIRDILSRVSNAVDDWRIIAERYEARIFVGIFMKDWNEGFRLSPTLLRKLANRYLPLDIDLYGKQSRLEAPPTSD